MPESDVARGIVPLAVTTSARPGLALAREAAAAAVRWGLPLVERREATLQHLLTTCAPTLVIFERERISLVDSEGQLHFHAGMAHLRMQRLATGEGDVMVRLAGIVPGDEVLDCTLGLGQDARVAAVAAGPEGRVVGLEQGLALFAVQDAGLRRLGADPGACAVEAVHAEALAFLRGRPDRSVDVVLFDPMFEAPKKAQPAFSLLRRHAHAGPLTREVLDEAVRVARRRVLIKVGRHGGTLQRLGLVPLQTSRYSDLSWCALEAGTRAD